ncbi:VacB/RNase II family 3'-5' exoribonuclease [Pseudomonas serbica]|uniref:VacB/RNase II family 3'-5' exoribonuclease n=1 Tax=Pseudomonas serbica TaxID=2965074 RepID=UPI00237AE899|nr:VacB/RNase II family 3'-5' exoribonuclease [Pseudomonas serbica]
MLKNNQVLMQLKAGFTATVSSTSSVSQSAPTLVTGIVRGTRKDYGFLKCADGTDHFLPPPQMSRCFHGDVVEAEIIDNHSGDGKTEACILRIVESSISGFVGVVRNKGHNPYIQPENPNLKRDFLIPRIKRGREREGDFVWARVIKHPFEDGGCHAEVEAVICSDRDRQAPWKVASARNGLKHEAPPFDHDEIQALNLTDDVTGDESFDWRHECLVTIDGENSRDLDDAVMAKRSGTDILLTVAIADPARFLIEDGIMDREARLRCFTTYYPGMSLPMLSKVISEQGASLVAGEDRSSVCCNMIINEAGEITDSYFFLATINSKAKLSYEAVQAFLDGDRSACPNHVADVLECLNEVGLRRRNWRNSHALASSRYKDYTFVVEDFALKSVRPSVQLQSNRLVEECMIAANFSFAQYMKLHGMPCVYRRHDGFKPERLEELVLLLAEHGVTTTAENLVVFEGYREVMRTVLALENPALEQLLIGFYAKSRHSTEFGPHYSLGLDGYATFTSPIRKYSDLMNHRSLKALLRNQATTVQTFTPEMMELLDEKFSATDRAARDVQNDLYIQLYQGKIGEQFDAVVTGVMPAGVKAEIIETGAPVFLSTRTLGRKYDVFEVSQDGMSLLKKGQPIAKIGQELKIIINLIDIPGRSINATLPAAEA